MIKDTGGPAFPTEVVNTNDGYIHQGMSLRDYFAAKAMQGLLASGIECGPDDVASVVASAYILADAMLKARQA
jgi:hypothetical protein